MSTAISTLITITIVYIQFAVADILYIYDSSKHNFFTLYLVNTPRINNIYKLLVSHNGIKFTPSIIVLPHPLSTHMSVAMLLQPTSQLVPSKESTGIESESNFRLSHT